MKLRCPRCQQRLTVPDKYAGRNIRCPSCNRAFTVPQPKAATSGPGTSGNLDLESLAQLEAHSTEMDSVEQQEAEDAVRTRQASEATEATAQTRICPTCKAEVSVKDPYAELLCSHCWSPIPALIKGEAELQAKRLAGAQRSPGSAGFYGGLAASIGYPISAIGSLATAAGIAVLAGILPVAIITLGTYVMAQSEVGTARGVQQGDLSGAQMILVAVFTIEVIFFSAVAIHAFLDVVRTTSIGSERAPNLTWNPTQWGTSLLAYLILGIYLLVATFVVAKLTIDTDPLAYMKDGKVIQLASSGGTKFLVGMAIVSFSIPMHLIGISLGSIVEGVNPSLVGQSILKTNAHYIFLVLIVVLFASLFGIAFMGILFDWFLPQVHSMIEGAKAGNISQVALSMLAWGLVMGVFFYATYVVGRLHGLFARTFRKKLMFGTM